ncbi:MAG: anti-sigma factor antagonist [Cyanobacteria bacterium J083]|nr:MAG: anti-sigma factor antagonist [Cyanobacteria bacterium J083]
MNITLDKQVKTIEPQGYVSAANADDFRADLTKVVESQEYSALLLDMKGVEFLDSAGLMALVTTFRLAQNLEVRFSICSLAPSVRMIFELTQLDKVFEIFDSRDSFESGLC